MKEPELFKSEFVPARQGSGELFEERFEGSDGPVVCLGMTFENDEARRAHFTEELRKKLQDPEFRKIEGFPIGTDEDILALSDPPYYTACPNPWIADFVEEWEKEKPGAADPQPSAASHQPYHREPFAADVSEGKNDPIYNAHSYHTKVPHKAIMRYILHYTEPGDIVFDGFCGTGMTGVAAQMCGDRETVESLGYKVKRDGTILQEVVTELEDGKSKTAWEPFSKLGARRAVLNDLSPAATFIAYNYNTPVDVKAFEREAKRILQEVEEECGWMYETRHTDGKTTGKINYTVWSDVFVCPDCGKELVFWEAAVDKEAGKVLDSFPCPHCIASLTKRSLDRAWVTKYDSVLNDTIQQAKQVPVLINYSVGKTRHDKKPDEDDLALIEKIENGEIPYWFPTEELPDGFNTRQPKFSHGITHVHHFYTKRNLWPLAAIKCKPYFEFQSVWFWVNAALRYLSKLSKLGTEYYFHGGGGAVNAGVLGTLYVPSFSVENNVPKTLAIRLPKLKRFFDRIVTGPYCLATGSSESFIVPPESLDYVFIDPPFGSNLNYSELSFQWEAWLKVWTNIDPEAIENSVQKKGPVEYRTLMTACFREAHRVLKPGHWMTVEFSNTKAAVWNSITQAIEDAGFIIANVSALDKKQGSFKAVTTPTAVKQDLVISAYKPNGGFEERFKKEAATEEGVWDFVRTHMKYLPVTKVVQGELVKVPERDPRLLFDQVVAYYVRKGYTVPLDSGEFQEGLHQRFEAKDGMYFLTEQLAEYNDAARRFQKPIQLSLFVSDEASAIEWLRNELRNRPQTTQDIHPKFIKELGGLKKTEKLPELLILLNQNFLCYEGEGAVPSQIHSYLSTNFPDLRNLEKDDPALRAKATNRWYVPDPRKAGDLEKLRERALLREFEGYKAEKKKLKQFRIEAIRAGFKQAWQSTDYETIIIVVEKLPRQVLEEDPKLLMWYDQAVTRTWKGSERL